jgi:hypothetical protein
VTPSDNPHPLDAKQFADEIVEPTIIEFEKEPWLRRRAFLACVVTNHLVDYIPGSSRQKYRCECPAFAAVERSANAFKHKSTCGRRPLRAEQVFSRPPARAGEMRAGLSRFGDTEGLDLLDDVKKAAAFLHSKLPP